MAVDRIAQEAIKRRLVLRLSYEGDRPGSERIVHPHALFFGPDGEWCLDVLQVGGWSDAAVLPAWRAFAVRRITGAEATAERFVVARDWDPDAERFKGGIAVMV